MVPAALLSPVRPTLRLQAFACPSLPPESRSDPVRIGRLPLSELCCDARRYWCVRELLASLSHFFAYLVAYRHVFAQVMLSVCLVLAGYTLLLHHKLSSVVSIAHDSLRTRQNMYADTVWRMQEDKQGFSVTEAVVSQDDQVRYVYRPT